MWPNRKLVKTIGIHPFGHDSAITVLDNENKDIFSISLERLSRNKHDYRFSMDVIDVFFDIDKDTELVFSMKDVSVLLIQRFEEKKNFEDKLKPISKILTKVQGNLNKSIAILFSNPGLLFTAYKYKKFLNNFVFERDMDGFRDYCSIRYGVDRKNIFFYDHHFCHACSAYYMAPSSFKNDCLVVTIDGQGDNSFCKVYTIEDNNPVQQIESSNSSSIPNLYSIFTQVLGFKASADEGKLEALACYGDMHKNHDLYKILNASFYVNGDMEILLKTNNKFPFYSITKQWSEIRDFLITYKNKMGEKDFSAVMQLFFEEFFLEYIVSLKSKYKVNKMAFAGGGFANVKLNLRLVEEANLDDIYICPAMGDDGTSIGAAIFHNFNNSIDVDWVRKIEMPFFGNSYDSNDVYKILCKNKDHIKFEYIENDSYKVLAKRISEGKICALFRGRMESGPRALGHRSILANPCDPGIRDQINLKFKKREWFQPFCPSILADDRKDLFEKSLPNKHMTCAFKIKDEFAPDLPSVVHVDGTARAQFIEKEDDHYYFNLISELKTYTGYGVILDTSFNIHGKTIVMSPQDALDDFFSCGLDCLMIEDYLVMKK